MKTAIDLPETATHYRQKRLAGKPEEYVLSIPKTVKLFQSEYGEEKVYKFLVWGYKAISDKAHLSSQTGTRITDSKLLSMSSADIEKVSAILGIDLSARKKALLAKKSQAKNNTSSPKTVVRKTNNGNPKTTTAEDDSTAAETPQQQVT